MAIPLLITGSNGLVASRFIKDFGDKYDVQPVDISNPDNPTDITNEQAVRRMFESSDAKAVLHFAAYTNVTGAWEQRDDKDGIAYQVNVTGTDNIVRTAADTGKHLVHISTAYVFDGEKDGLYTEDDVMNPIEWYGQTKAEAEEKVQASNHDWTILRIDQPFRSDPFEKVDTAHRIVEGLRSNSLYPQFTDHYFGPTYLNDFSKVLDEVISKKLTGLYHASSGEKWSDYDFAVAIKEAFGFETEVKEGLLDAYLKTLGRPYQRNTALDNTKLMQVVDFTPTPIAEALKTLEF